MRSISQETIREFRALTFRTAPGTSIRKPEEAIQYVDERGFIFFWPVKGLVYPSLWTAVAGDRQVADEHDDPGHVTWSWKDSLLDKRVWYYGRVLHKKNTFISNSVIPFFYALSPNYGEPEVDFEDQYQQGLLPLEAKLIFDALVKRGPLDTISLRKESHLTGSTSNSPFNRGLDILQAQLKILPVAISEAGAWKYAFVYDLTHRYYPELVDQSRDISEQDAMDHLILLQAKSLGAFILKDVTTLFGWKKELTERSLTRLVRKGLILEGVSVEAKNGEFYCLGDLIK